MLVMDLEAGLVQRQLESLSCQVGVVLWIVGAAGVIPRETWSQLHFGKSVTQVSPERNWVGKLGWWSR